MITQSLLFLTPVLSSTWIQTIATVTIALLTFFYVRYTKALLGATQSGNRDEKMPVVVFRFRETKSEDGSPQVEDRLVNIGLGPALNLRFETNFLVDGQNSFTGLGTNLRPWSVDNALGADNGDPALQINFFTTIGRSSCLRDPKIHLRATYEDVYGRRYETVFQNNQNSFRKIS